MLTLVVMVMQLDHSASVESLEKMTIYFRQLYNIFLAHEKPDCVSLLTNHTRTLMAATASITLDVSALKISMQVRTTSCSVSVFSMPFPTCFNILENTRN